MNVTQYTFQSPYSSQVQVGRLDPSSQKSDTLGKDNPEFVKDTNTSLTSAKNLQAEQAQEVKPAVNSKRLLDIYA